MSYMARWSFVGSSRLIAAAAVGFVGVLLLWVGPSGASAQNIATTQVEFSFDAGSEGWEVGFADLPIDYEPTIYELDSSHRRLPDGLEGSGVYIQGHNRSDDLFMFMKRRIDGLQPSTVYTVRATVQLAANVPAGLAGIGGSPGSSVFVKAGASTKEPEGVEDNSGYLRMNIDKGNQATGGDSMVVLGNVENPEVLDVEYRFKTLDGSGLPVDVATDEEGGLWLIVGTDSGFEGLTTLYYSRIAFSLTAPEPPDVGDFSPNRGLMTLIAFAALVATGAGVWVLARPRRA